MNAVVYLANFRLGSPGRKILKLTRSSSLSRSADENKQPE
jgi:hypothetical protein